MPTQFKSAKDCIILNETESEIFQLLRDCCNENKLDVVLRIAGGWVRDKLLGLECKDCDIAIDKLMGHRFAEHFRRFLISKGISSSAYGVIQANPDRSKHLETATLKVHDYPIDFVNLRSETYSDESRIPIVKFGTPLEDALRRDITINSLFYNISTEEVEDFCGFGFEDLTNGIIRTPLPPKETLLDDPLRLLRVIRFSTRFQFKIEEELQLAISDEQVDSAFRNKISRERVGTELEKIFNDKNSFQGICLLEKLKVFNLVFDIPSDIRLQEKISLPNNEIIESILEMYQRLSLAKESSLDSRLNLLTHCLLPHQSIVIKKREGRKRDELLAAIIVRESIKFTNQDICDITVIFNNLEAVVFFLRFYNEVDRITMGRLIKALGTHWQVAFHVAASKMAVLNKEIDPHSAIELCMNAIRLIHKNCLEDAWKWKTILSGSEIQNLVSINEGREVGKWISILFDWQFENPHGSKDMAIEYLKGILTSSETLT